MLINLQNKQNLSKINEIEKIILKICAGIFSLTKFFNHANKFMQG